MALIELNNINFQYDDIPSLVDISLSIEKGESVGLEGDNGSGKSTLANSIMNHPKYILRKGSIFFEGKDITEDKVDERARKGIFMSFQNPLEVAGITVGNFLRSAVSAREGSQMSLVKFGREIGKQMEALDMKPEYIDRYLNYGFSGGEKKKTEILQMRMLKPKLAILDETDSGLDVDAVRIVSEGIQQYKTEENSLLIITHHREIIEQIKPDFVHIIIDGRIVKTGDASLIDKIEEKGYGWLKEEVNQQ